MSLPVDWLSEAIQEAREARRRYVKVNSVTARKFSEELKAVEAIIAAMPQVSSPGKQGTRFIVLRTFPYVVHFQILPDCVQIVAIAHSRRHPDYWHSRLP